MYISYIYISYTHTHIYIYIIYRFYYGSRSNVDRKRPRLHLDPRTPLVPLSDLVKSCESLRTLMGNMMFSTILILTVSKWN